MTSRPGSDQVRAIVAEVAAERGVPVEDICSKKKAGGALDARRMAMRRARAAGATYAAISEVIGISEFCTRMNLRRNEAKALDDLQGIPPAERVRLGAPFVRRNGRLSPLTVEDYACRAEIDEARAAEALARLVTHGLARKVLLRAVGNLPIYEWCGGDA